MMFGLKPKASRNSKQEVTRCYFEVDNVEMYFDYSDILDVITEHSFLEDVLETYDERHGTDFAEQLGDNALALYRNRLDQLPDCCDPDAPEVRSWPEALAVAASVPRVRLSRNGKLMDLFLDGSSGDVRKDVRRYDLRHGTHFAKHIEAGEAVIVPYSPDTEIAYPVETWDDVIAYADRRR